MMLMMIMMMMMMMMKSTFNNFVKCNYPYVLFCRPFKLCVWACFVFSDACTCTQHYNFIVNTVLDKERTIPERKFNCMYSVIFILYSVYVLKQKIFFFNIESWTTCAFKSLQLTKRDNVATGRETIKWIVWILCTVHSLLYENSCLDQLTMCH